MRRKRSILDGIKSCVPSRIRPILGGIKTYIPFMSSLEGTGGTNSARYCYSVWLRHLSTAFKNGLRSYPKSIAELGPGDSIGIGLAGVIGGAEQYYALDIVEHATTERNVEIFDELVALFKNREDIPDEKEFPMVYPRLKSYQFLYDIFSQDILNNALNENRINNIRKDLLSINNKDSSLRYICPWFVPEIIEVESVDMVFSQAVLEHVDDLEHTYKTLHRWLKKGGIMSHQIDFTSHHLTDEWNGHWAYSDISWRVIRGNRPYFLNREPLSTHIKNLGTAGFRVSYVVSVKNNDGINRNRLASRYKKLSNEDLTTTSAQIISRKE